MTGGFLTQQTLINEDFMLLRCKDFERILIFDREDEYNLMFDSSDGKNRSLFRNESKEKFLKVLHLVLSIIASTSHQYEGQLALVKKMRSRPSYVDLEPLIRME